MFVVALASVAWVLFAWAALVARAPSRHLPSIVGLGMLMSVVEALLVAAWSAEYVRREVMPDLSRGQRAVFLVILFAATAGFIWLAL
ncbi:MAG: hypothetical protein K6V73_06315 [Firmicutes bacterium]|nr:hypothetical protein [Bacillota bacterium]